MGSDSKIAWTDHSFNAWIGCSKVSEACKSCYAEVDTFARRKRARGIELWGADADRHITSDAYWKQPARWNAAALRDGVRRRVFCASLADVFEGRPDLDFTRGKLWKLIEQTPALDWLLLTKRPENMRRMLPSRWLERPLPNVWLGTTVENRARAEERIPHLLDTPARVRFLSCEPLLEEIDLDAPRCQHCYPHNEIGRAEDGTPWCLRCECEACYGMWLDSCADEEQQGINWVIVGGESGPKARPFDLGWARSIVRQCKDAGVPVFVKQLGARPRWNGIVGPSEQWPASPLTHDNGQGSFDVTLNDRKGGDMAEWPEDLCVRELPRSDDSTRIGEG